MKSKILLISLALTGLVNTAHADVVDLKNYKIANDYIKKENITITRAATQVFAQNSIIVVGEGVPKKGTNGAQRRLTALRAAEVAAQRSLAEILNGVSLIAGTTVGDAATKSKEISSSVATFIKGFSPVVKDWNDREETALVILKTGMNGKDSFGAMIYDKILNEPNLQDEVEKPVYAPPAEMPPPPPAPQDFDGLIIDATTYNFRPALINRIFSHDGQVIYDPARISQKTLVEQGCGDYTNSIDKARAALGKRGVKYPLVVKASGTTSPADLQVSADTANQIYAASKANGFMNDAKVAFVLR